MSLEENKAKNVPEGTRILFFIQNITIKGNNYNKVNQHFLDTVNVS